MRYDIVALLGLMLCGCGGNNRGQINKPRADNVIAERETQGQAIKPGREMKNREIKNRSGRTAEQIRAEYDTKELTADDLKNLSFAEIEQRLGQPAEVYRSKKRQNLGLAIWATGNDKYTVVSFLESIDGSLQTVILTSEVNRTRSIVENMKRTLDKQ